MSECGRLSDRIPSVVLGRDQWTPQELEHLDECGSCHHEWMLVQAAGRLGAGAEERFEPNDIATSVIQRLQRTRETERTRRTRWTIGGLAAAAALVAALWTGGRTSNDTAQPNGSLATAELAFPLPELESLQPAELDSVLQTMDEGNVGSAMEEPDLGDLNSDELERVLDSWEG